MQKQNSETLNIYKQIWFLDLVDTIVLHVCAVLMGLLSSPQQDTKYTEDPFSKMKGLFSAV